MKKIHQAQPKGRVYVKSKYDYMSISPKIALAEIKKYRSYMMTGGTKLGVIPKSRFRKEKE